MTKPSDINAIINDPTAQLTDADKDPIGSAAKEAKAWVGQGDGAMKRSGAYSVDPYRDEHLRARALELAIDSTRGESFADEYLIGRAKSFEAFLRGEASD